jgi:catechol 2,3-dioxygenase-like lactoylglutathione lyase family enzyme
MTTESTAGATGVLQIAINVYDVQRALRFYRDVLGFPLLFEIPNAAFVQAGSVRLYLAIAEQPEHDHLSSILYYQVADIHAAFNALRAAGTSIESEPHFLAKMADHDLWMGSFRDSEGNLAALMSEVR